MEDTQDKEQFMCGSQGGPPKRCRDIFNCVSLVIDPYFEREVMEKYRSHFTLVREILCCLSKVEKVLREYEKEENRLQRPDREMVFINFPLILSNTYSIFLLSSQGYSIEASVILRSLIERALDVAYIIIAGGDNRDELARLHIEHWAVEYRDLMLEMLKYPNLPERQARGIKTTLECVEECIPQETMELLEKGKKFRSWRDLAKVKFKEVADRKSMAHALGWRWRFFLSYKLYSMAVHSSSASGQLYSPDFKQVLQEPSDRGVDEVLAQASFWTLVFVDAFNRFFANAGAIDISALRQQVENAYRTSLAKYGLNPEP